MAIARFEDIEARQDAMERAKTVYALTLGLQTLDVTELMWL